MNLKKVVDPARWVHLFREHIIEVVFDQLTEKEFGEFRELTAKKSWAGG